MSLKEWFGMAPAKIVDRERSSSKYLGHMEKYAIPYISYVATKVPSTLLK
jgi:hypothetical protein